MLNIKYINDTYQTLKVHQQQPVVIIQVAKEVETKLKSTENSKIDNGDTLQRCQIEYLLTIKPILIKSGILTKSKIYNAHQNF